MITKPKLVLHVCCAVCGAALVKVLQEKFQVILFYYNPNIWPREEYEKRLEAVVKLSEIYGVILKKGKYENKLWLKRVKGFENEPEGGKRCPICFQMRLEKTADLAKSSGALYFATTLAISPFKNEAVINEIAQEVAKDKGLIFLSLADIGDKNNLWQETRLLAKQYQLYHQKYCGCQFSLAAMSKKQTLAKNKKHL